MADDDGIRLRNVSPFGDVDVPDLGQIVQFHHEVVVVDETVAARLIETGHFTAVAKPGPKTEDDPPAPAGDTDPATAGDQPTTAGADQ
jgi:hypothetical protein